MSVKSDKVKSGYAELTEAEKAEVREFIRQYDNSIGASRDRLLESTTRTFNKSLGPKDSHSCPCCGK